MSENGQNKKREKENTNRSNRKTSNETTDIQGIEAKIETVNKGYLPVFMDLDDEKKKHGVKTPRMKNEGLVVVDIQSKGKSMQHAEDAENGEVTGIKTDEFVNKKGATSSVVMGEDARKREDAVRDRNAEYLDRRNKAMRTRREDNGSTRVKKSKVGAPESMDQTWWTTVTRYRPYIFFALSILLSAAGFYLKDFAGPLEPFVEFFLRI